MKIAVSVGLIVVIACSIADAQSDADPSDANWQVDLIGLFGAVKDRATGAMVPNNLGCMMNFREGKVVAGVGWAPRFNRGGHRVTKADIELKPGDRFVGTIEVVLYPDRWKPKDGK